MRIPQNIWKNNIVPIEICSPLINAKKIQVSVNAIGSFDPLSSSKRDAVLYFKFKFFEERIFDTDA